MSLQYFFADFVEVKGRMASATEAEHEQEPDENEDDAMVTLTENCLRI